MAPLDLGGIEHRYRIGNVIDVALGAGRGDGDFLELFRRGLLGRRDGVWRDQCGGKRADDKDGRGAEMPGTVALDGEPFL